MFSNEVNTIVKLFRLYRESLALADKIVDQRAENLETIVEYKRKRRELDVFRSTIRRKPE